MLDNKYQCVTMHSHIGTRTLYVHLQAMRLRRAVPKAPAKPSVPPGLPLHKSRHFLTRSKSTLLQLMIPLRFNSRRTNAYRKPREGRFLPTEKFVNSSLPSPRHAAHAGTTATRIVSWAYFTTSVHNGGGGTGHPIRPSRTAHAPAPRPRASRADSRYTTGFMLATTILDTNWMGRARSIA